MSTSRSAALAVTIGALACPTTLIAAQTCDTQRYPLSTVAERFQPNDDGTLTDAGSRLMWMRCSAGQSWSGGRCTGAARSVTYDTAQSLARAINQDGSHFYSDWRIPQVAELATITERQCANPRVDLALFPDTPAEPYWTATARPAASEGSVFTLSFGPEGLRFVDKGQAHHVRLVRNAR